MNRLSTAELQRIARETFGREFSEAQAEAYRGRLLILTRSVQLLQEWEKEIRDSEPAVVYHTPLKTGEDYGIP